MHHMHSALWKGTTLLSRVLRPTSFRGFGALPFSYVFPHPPPPPTRISTLDNQMRVATETWNTDTATVGVWIDAGSRFEGEETNGVAHFLEHMAFKGTKSRRGQTLEVEIENMGAHLNAYTSRDMTVYYAKCFKKDIPKCVEILADILTHSTYDAPGVERERSTILREMEEVESDKAEVIFDRLHEAAYKGQTLGYTILGPEQNIRNISRANLVDYVRTHYTTPRMVMAAAGGVEHDELCDLVGKHFADVPMAPPLTKGEVGFEPARFLGNEIRELDETFPTCNFAVAYEGVGWRHPDSFAMMVMQSLLGQWDRNSGGGKNVSSRMCRAIAEGELAHSVMSFNTFYQDTALFGVYGVCDPMTTPACMHRIQEEITRLCYSLNEGELVRAKNQLKANLMAHVDGTTNICEEIGRHALVYGRRLPTAEIFARIDSLTTGDIKRVASDRFYDQEVAFAAYGQLKGLPDYNQLVRRTYWLRY